MSDALFKAIGNDDADAIRAALANGASLEARTRQGLSPLAWACLRSEPIAVRALLDAGAPVNVEAAPGQSLLGFAIFNSWKHKSVATLELLLDAGADVNGVEDGGLTPLHQAALLGPYPEDSVRSARLLLKRGAVVDARDENGQTPLHIAVGTIAEETVDALLAAGADPNARDEEGGTPLTIAIQVFRAMTDGGMDPDEAALVQVHHVPRLLAAGADPHAADANGARPLHHALRHKGYPEDVISALLKAGADPSLPISINGKPMLPLTMAYLKDFSTAVLLELIDHGADPDAPIAQQPAGESLFEVARRKKPELALAIEQHRASKK
ncbi:ankyrin repeat domain-containing protein [Pyxidicoccus xibeiensis]|uniref:ankyrin repeat domain-containing protein n=1 Tax=Pyxidicoccus xibeiensis TaxID=2906759 RepID=UPI0020A71722|nr:ankyrin repeat domain-containing protein [Pyxidicoccus xibeiensis]MCP3143810.1 ankyrin repeat domain-containing protein [Pyxidicoccus xibeiensis]